MILRYVRSLATTESSPHRSWRLHYYFLSGYIIFQILQQILRDIVRGKTDKRRRKREKERKKRRWSIECKGGDFLRRRFLDRSPGKKKEKKKEKKGKGQVRGDATLGRGRAGKEKATKASLWSAEGEGEFTKVNEPARIKRRKGKEEESA